MAAGRVPKALEKYVPLITEGLIAPITEAELPATPEPILRRLMVARAQKGKEETFDHALPAHELTAMRADFFGQVDSATLDRFEEVFRLLRS